MPLLSNKLYILNKIKKEKKDEESPFCHPLTNEICDNEEEFKRKTFLYNQKIWTCRISGQINLTFKEALKSEQGWAKMLKNSFKKCFETAVLQFVHHSKESLDTLVHKAWTQIHHEFCVNEPVTIKLTAPKEMILKGIVVKVDRSKSNEEKEQEVSPTKLNSDASSSDKENMKKKIIPVKKSYFYSVKIFEMDKLVKDIPAETIDRTLRPPSKDQIRMFIRAHAIRHSGKQNNPWVVDDDLVKKYRLPVLEPEFVVDKMKMKELSHLTEIQMYNKIREEAFDNEKRTMCVDLTKSDDEDESNTKLKKTSESNRENRGKKKLKQATLFDVQVPASQNGPQRNTIRSPLSSPTRSLPPLAQRLFKLMKDNPNDPNIKQLIFRCCQMFSIPQINKFPDLIRSPIKAKKEKVEEKKKLDAMTPAERDVFLTAKRNLLRAQQREKKREENVKLEDIEIEYMKQIPRGAPVVVEEGMSQDQWARLVSMSEFVRCYKKLLVPSGNTGEDNSVLLVKDLCRSVIGNTDNDHAVLAELVCVLLKTLLQDNRIRNRKEMGLGLAELPVTACTAGELLRLVLPLGNETKETKTTDDVDNENEENEDNKEHVDYTEESEMLTNNNNKIAGPICEKLETNELHELSIEDKISVLELLQGRILELDIVSSFIDDYQRELCEAYKKKVSDTKEFNDKLKVLRQNKHNMSRLIVVPNISSTTGSNDNSDQLNEESSQVVRRRQSIELKQKESEEKERRLEKERQFQKLEKEELTYRKSIEQIQKVYTNLLNDAKQLMRIQPLGCDRHFCRYWHFSTIPGVLYVETDVDQSSLAFGEPNKTEWTMYTAVEEVNNLIDSLCEKGIRESSLLESLRFMLPKLKEEMEIATVNNKVFPLISEEKESFLVTGFKQELKETELSIRQGSLGGVEDYDHWNTCLTDAVTLKDMKESLITVFLGVHERFWSYPMKSASGRNEFLSAVEHAQTQGRLNVLQSFLDACVCWSKSAKDDKCRVCRKNTHENSMLLCDSCNHAFHMFCLRPPLHEIPEGEWFCPHCKPVSRARDNEGHNDSTLTAATNGKDKSKPKTRQGGNSNQELCCVCHIRNNDQLAKCTSCKKCFHAQCHEPTLRQIRRTNWHCCECRLDEVTSHKNRQHSNKSRWSLSTERQEDQNSEDAAPVEQSTETVDIGTLTPKSKLKKPAKKQEKLNGVVRRKRSQIETENETQAAEEEEVSDEESHKSSSIISKPSRKKSRYETKVEETKKASAHVSDDLEESDQDTDNLSSLYSKRSNRKRSSAVIEDTNGGSDTSAPPSNKKVRTSLNGGTTSQAGDRIEKACQTMLRHLFNHKASWPFRDAVDPKEVPDYYQIISDPMDLVQMMDKCKQGAYRTGLESLKQFLADIGQIFFNAEMYNLPDSKIMGLAYSLEQFFKSIYSKYDFGVEYSRMTE